MTEPALVLIGAGRVARHLGRRWLQAGLPIRQLWNRSPETAAALASGWAVPWSSDSSKLDTSADWYLVCVSDYALPQIFAWLQQVLPSEKLVLHTSGTTPIHRMAPFFERYGVFYPLQSFTLAQPPDWNQVPLLVAAARPTDEQQLVQVAQQLSGRVHTVTDEQRAQLHVAAVFANNFTNHCYAIAEQLCSEQGLSFELLHPLIRETAQRIQSIAPTEAQTGPAIRNDQQTMVEHIDRLREYPAWQMLYQLMSADIQRNSGTADSSTSISD